VPIFSRKLGVISPPPQIYHVNVGWMLLPPMHPRKGGGRRRRSRPIQKTCGRRTQLHFLAAAIGCRPPLPPRPTARRPMRNQNERQRLRASRRGSTIQGGIASRVPPAKSRLTFMTSSDLPSPVWSWMQHSNPKMILRKPFWSSSKMS